MSLKSLGIALVGLFVCNLGWAATTSLQGVVKDPNGKPVKGADVRIEGKSNFAKIAKTDASGHYFCTDLAVGTYHVTLMVNGSVKASINNAAIKSDQPNQLNFDLKQASAGKSGTKKPTHMVYMPSDTGSHLGGRWVEVDDQGNPVGAGGAGSDNVKKVGNDAIRNMQMGGH